jgi:C1A family cysteine protease
MWQSKNYGRKFKLGLKGKSKGFRKPMVMKAVQQVVPTAFDWRDQGFVSTVKDQGNCGSCWAFSSVGALEAATMIADKTPNTNLDLSEQIVISCDSGDYGCDGGYMDVVSDFLKDSGTGAELCYPYTATNGRCSTACPDKGAFKVDSWAWVNADVDSIKAALLTYGPLVVTMNVYSDFMYYASGIYKSQRWTWFEGGHAVLLVGYDDATQAFTVKNSWGTNWGENGYFRIAYSEIGTKVAFAEETIYYTVAPIPPTPPPVPPAPGTRQIRLQESLDGGSTWQDLYSETK